MRCAAVALLFVLAGAAEAMAQARPQPSRPPAAPQRPTMSARVFGDVGFTTFTAKDSFEATLGSAAGAMFGGGGEVVLPQRIFFGVRVARFTADGERVFVNNGQVFPLGIPMTVSVTPILLTAGYRFGRPGATLYPYVGGGIGWHKYEETSEFAGEGEDVNETFIGYHVVGGAEYRLARLFGIAGEAQWAGVPEALGQSPSSAATAFGESDLGGFTVRIKLVIGR
jgi:opacity protein-like surface antigen